MHVYAYGMHMVCVCHVYAFVWHVCGVCGMCIVCGVYACMCMCVTCVFVFLSVICMYHVYVCGMCMRVA